MKQLEPYFRRIKMMVGRGVVRLVGDGSKIQTVQLGMMQNEVRSNLERFQNYGFTGVPHAGAEAAVMFVGGNRDHGIVVAVDDRRYRIKGMQVGEVAVYTDEGDEIRLKRGNKIEFKTKNLVINATEGVKINSPKLEVSGDITDNTESGNEVTVREMREVYNVHTHDGDSGGTTSEPRTLME